VARVGYGEYNQRAWLALWADHLRMPEPGAHPVVSARPPLRSVRA
jgi:hypothetical protein